MIKEEYLGQINELKRTIQDLKATNLLLKKDNHNLTEALYGSYKRIKELNDERTEQL